MYLQVQFIVHFNVADIPLIQIFPGASKGVQTFGGKTDKLVFWECYGTK